MLSGPRRIWLLSVFLWTTASVAQESDARHAHRGAILDGDKIYAHWAAPNLVSHAIVAWDLTQKQLLWRYDVAPAEPYRLYLAKRVLLCFTRTEVIWLDRETGTLRKRVDGSGWPYGDRVVTANVLYDLETGERLGDLQDPHSPSIRYFDADILLDAVRKPGESAEWVLREYNRATGQVAREIPLRMGNELLDEVSNSNLAIDTVIGRHAVLVVWRQQNRRIVVHLESGEVTWASEQAPQFCSTIPLGDDLLLIIDPEPAAGESKMPSTLVAIDGESGLVRWQSEAPPFAPLIFLAEDGKEFPVVRSNQVSSLHPLRLRLEDGKPAPEAGVTALENLAWQIGTFHFSNVRRAGERSFTVVTPVGNPAVVYAWETQTGKLAWSQKVNIDGATHWVPEVAAEPRYLAVSSRAMIHLLDPDTGKSEGVFEPGMCGLKFGPRPQDSQVPSREAGGTSLRASSGDTSVKNLLQTIGVPLLMVAMLVMGWLWARTRPPSPRP